MKRYDVIKQIMSRIDEELVICNIGFASRELYEIDDRSKNFYMTESMGLASSIGLGLAIARPYEDIVVIDGDGSLLMNMGSLATVFANNPSNLTWIVIDNGVYGSRGNQDSYAQYIDLVDIARGVGFQNSYYSDDVDLKEFIKSDDTSFIVYRTEPGNSDAPEIDIDPITIKERFMSSI